MVPHATALGRVVGHGQTLSERLHAGATASPKSARRCSARRSTSTPSSPPKARRRRRTPRSPPPPPPQTSRAAITRSTRHLVQRQPPASTRHLVQRRLRRRGSCARRRRRGAGRQARSSSVCAELAKARAEMARAAMAAAAAASGGSSALAAAPVEAAAGSVWALLAGAHSARRASTPFGQRPARRRRTQPHGGGPQRADAHARQVFQNGPTATVPMATAPASAREDDARIRRPARQGGRRAADTMGGIGRRWRRRRRRTWMATGRRRCSKRRRRSPSCPMGLYLLRAAQLVAPRDSGPRGPTLYVPTQTLVGRRAACRR